MAVITLSKITGRMQLNNGTDADGNMKTVAVSLGDLNESYFAANMSTAADKMLAVIGLLEPCLSKTVVSAETVEYSTVAPNA